MADAEVKKRPTTTGRVYNVPADQTNWRKKLQQSRIKFDDVAKQKFLNAYLVCNNRREAAEAAGVSTKTIDRHREIDPDFLEAMDQAGQDYAASVQGEVRHWAFEGVVTERYDKDGNLVSITKAPATEFLKMEAKRTNPAYREKQEVQIDDRRSGVLEVPAMLEGEAYEAYVKDRETAELPEPGSPEDEALQQKILFERSEKAKVINDDSSTD